MSDRSQQDLPATCKYDYQNTSIMSAPFATPTAVKLGANGFKSSKARETALKGFNNLC